jgi:RNA polymerase sigma-70 factor (ECF subfamily)
MPDDADDLSAARSGGERGRAAFARLYDRHAPVVLALCRHAGAGDAEDALQETFIRAYGMLDRVADASGFRAWLYAIARRVCAERRRAAGRRGRHESEGAMTAAALHPVETPPAAAGRAEQLERLGRALDRLPDDERLAIHLYFLDADPVSAAGAALGLSRSAFYRLLARARQRLASIMTPTQAALP